MLLPMDRRSATTATAVDPGLKHRLDTHNPLIFKEKRRPTISCWTPLDGVMVELAGFEPASASLLRAVLHV